jgi:hypothetical protein
VEFLFVLGHWKQKRYILSYGTVKWYTLGNVTITIHLRLSEFFSLCDVGNTYLAVMCQHSCDRASRITCVFFMHKAFRVAALCKGYKQQPTHKNGHALPDATKTGVNDSHYAAVWKAALSYTLRVFKET